MNLQPTLSNDLILLRPLQNSDFEALYTVAKDPLIWEQHPVNNRFKKEVFTEFFKDSLDSKGALLAIEKVNGKTIGSSRFKPVQGFQNAVEIGWSFLAREYWGGKYNYAMKKLMIDHAFQSVDDVIFYIGPNNLRSQKAVEKIGGNKISGPEFRHLTKDGSNELTYRISKNAWLGSR